MKRSERRLLEEKLRYVAMEDIQPDPEREQQLLEEIKADFMRQSAEADAQITSGRHRIGRRVLIVSAAAVLIMALSFGFAVLAPESVSHAKGFVRSAAIWVNNTLHLGYEFEEPVATPALSFIEDATYATLEEAAAHIPYPLVYLDDPNFELQSIIVQNISSFCDIAIAYQNDSAECLIKLAPAADSTLISISNDSHTIIPWQHGNLDCWEANGLNYALTYYSGLEITIRGMNIQSNDFLSLCETLKVFN